MARVRTLRPAAMMVIAVLMTLFPVAGPPSARAAEVSVYYADSVPGDNTGPGYPTVWSQVGWSVTEVDAGGVTGVLLTAFGPGGAWRDFDFHAPAGQHLVAGNSYTGGEWTGFTVHELDHGGASGHLAISFWKDVAAGVTFRGELRYQSAFPLRALTLDAAHVSLPAAPVGSASKDQTIVVGSRGSQPLTISSVAFSPATTDFSIASETCTTTPVAPGGTCEVVVRFTPHAGGWRTATLAVHDDTVRGAHSVRVNASASLPVVSAGYVHGCALATDGTLTCWGNGADDATNVPAGTYKAVSAGNGFTCAIKSDDTLACWGTDGEGQVSGAPTGTYTAVSAGGWHACAIRTDGTLTCWGYDEDGEVSDTPAGTFSAVSAGTWHSCAVRTDETLACWGYDDYGDVSGAPDGTFSAVSAGGYHSCAVRTGGTLACWGSNEDGQATPPTGTFSGVSAGLYHSCGLRSNGTLACWGYNSDGQTRAPTGTFLAVSAGGFHSCALKPDGTPVCWGWNYYNQATTAAPAATTYVPVAPVRLLDSRSGNGVSGPFVANVPKTFQVTGRVPAIPAGAVAVTGNLTVTGQTAAGYAALTPVATSSPTTSTLNFPRGDNRANNVTAALGPDGKLGAVYIGAAGKTANLIFDVTGYFLADDTGATYHPVDPARVLDSRIGKGAGQFHSRTKQTVTVATVASGVPTDAVAVTGNVTVTGQTRSGYVTVAPSLTTGTEPPTSTLNFPVGDNRANGVTVSLASGGKLDLMYWTGSTADTTHLIFDVTGYYLADLTGAHFYPLAPDRLLDTRYEIGLTDKLTSKIPEELVTAARVGVPAGASAVSGNLTVVNQSKSGYVAMTRTPTATPTTSTLNFPAGDTRANGVTGPLGTGSGGTGSVGLVYVATTGATTNLILDITGYFMGPAPAGPVPASPTTPAPGGHRPAIERGHPAPADHGGFLR